MVQQCGQAEEKFRVRQRNVTYFVKHWSLRHDTLECGDRIEGSNREAVPGPDYEEGDQSGDRELWSPPPYAGGNFRPRWPRDEPVSRGDHDDAGRDISDARKFGQHRDGERHAESGSAS